MRCRRPGFEVAEEDESPLPERRLETPADGAVEHLVHVRPVAEQVGQVEHQQLGREGGERGIRGGRQFHGPDDREFDDVPFVPERVVRVDLDRDTAARRRGDLAREDFEALDGGLICRGARAGLDRDAASFRRPAPREQDQNRQDRQDRQDGQEDGSSPEHHSMPSQRGRIVTASGNTVIATSTATMASTGRTVQIATSLMLFFAIVQATKRVAP